MVQDGNSALQLADAASHHEIKTLLEEGTIAGKGRGTELEMDVDYEHRDTKRDTKRESENMDTERSQQIENADIDKGLEHLPELERKVTKLQRVVCDLESEFPPSCVCAITCSVMTDPVVIADGYTYEKSAIEDWLEKSNQSPQTNETLSHKNLLPNRNMKADIAERVDNKLRELGMSTK